MRTHSDGTSFSDYSKEITGYAWEALPAELTEVSRSTASSNIQITINWANYNDISELENLLGVEYEIYRTKTDDLSDFILIDTHEEAIGPQASLATNYTYVDDSYQLDANKTYVYKVKTRYRYDYTNTNGDYRQSSYEVEGVSMEESDSGEPTIDYTASSLGVVASSTSGSITQLEDKYIDNNLYVGAIIDAGSSGYGKPALYQYTGSAWQEMWPSLPDVSFNKISFAVGSAVNYMAGISDSLCVYMWDGADWSNNLTPDNLGKTESPSSVSIATLNDELYMAVKQAPDYELMVMKYTGSNWETIGGDASGIIDANAFAPKLQNLEGTLYLTYTHNDNIYIKHLNGTTWATDLQWTHVNAGNIKIAKSSAALYFMIGESGSGYLGGIYKVSGTSSADELVSNTTHEWFYSPYDLTVDTDGNLIVASTKYESQTLIYPILSVYDGSAWMNISGDFSNGIDPVTVHAIGTDLYYLYGDATTEDALGYPTSISATQFVK
jgi:hypothetical protein